MTYKRHVSCFPFPLVLQPPKKKKVISVKERINNCCDKESDKEHCFREGVGRCKAFKVNPSEEGR